MKTARTNFSQVQKNDYKDLLELYSNPDVRKYLGGVISEKEFSKKFKNFLAATSPEIYWVIRDNENGNFIGLTSVSLHHDGTNHEISYELMPDYWEQGYGSEVTKAVVKHAFRKLKLEQLYAETQKKNIASNKLLKRVGMKELKEVERFNETQVIYLLKNKPQYTYIAQCADQTLYTGYTVDLVAREAVHNTGKGAAYTRARLPVQFIYHEVFENKSDALKREYAIKQLTRVQKLELVDSFSLDA